MKLNFWQILGLILLIIAAILFFTRRIGNQTATTLPATTVNR